jgi:cytoskeletal protein CcmA (bactofilin family)
MARMRNRLVAVSAFVLSTLLAGAPVALAQVSTTPSPSPTPGADVPPNPEDQIVLAGRVVVDRGQSSGEIVVFSGHVQVAGVVQGDVVVVDGPVLISGQVSGSVISFDGPVRLTATAQVSGDVIAREEVELALGSQVGGQVRAHAPFTFKTPARILGRFSSWLAVSVSTLLLGLLLLWLVPRGADRVLRAARETPWISATSGLVMSMLLPVAGALFVLSLVALPLGLGLLLALALLLFVAYTWSLWVLGSAIVREHGRLLTFLAGWAIARAVGLIPVVSGVTFGLAAMFGLGAMTVAIWRARGMTRRGGGSHRRGHVALPEASHEEPVGEPIA